MTINTLMNKIILCLASYPRIILFITTVLNSNKKAFVP